MTPDTSPEGISLEFDLTARKSAALADMTEVNLPPVFLRDVQPGSGDHDDEPIAEPRLRDLPITIWNIPRFILLALIRLYQATFSRALPSDTCRFYPTCSHYGYQAIYKYGVIKGGLMAAWRVLRCNPFNPGGFDPLP